MTKLQWRGSVDEKLRNQKVKKSKSQAKIKEITKTSTNLNIYLPGYNGLYKYLTIVNSLYAIHFHK